MYNLTNYTSAIGLHEQAVALNSLSGGVLGISIVISVYIIIFVGMKKYDKDFKESFLASSLIVSVICFPLFALNMIYWQTFIIVLITFFASILIYKFTD